MTLLLVRQNGFTPASSSDAHRGIQVWDALTGQHVLKCDNPYDQVNNLVWSPDGQRIASAGGFNSEGIAQIWNAITGKLIYIYTGHTDFVTPIAWSPNGKYIASGGGDETVQVWQAV